MIRKDAHPSDQDLLLAADGELPEKRQTEIRRHLQACWACRRRMAEVESTISDFIDGYHALLDSQIPTEGGPEALLRTRLFRESPVSGKHRGEIWSIPIIHWRWPVLAAFTLLVIVASFGFWRLQTQHISTRQIMLNLQAATIPNPSFTPGETTPASTSQVCQVHAQVQNQHVPEALKEAVFSEYGIKNAPRNAYEVDFLITPELGGSASIRNLWPEPYYAHSWNAHTKDTLEDRLHTLVCSGDLDLSTAQKEIATNWVDAYKKYVRPDHPM
jgi:hypothetical protein